MATKKRQRQPELQQITNEPQIVPAFGRKYPIARFNLGQLSQALDYAGYIGALLSQASQLGPAPTTADVIAFATQGLSVCSPAFIPLLSIATKEPVEWLEEQDPIEGMELFGKVVEKNLDFFTPANRQRMQAAFGGLLQRIEGSGTDSSTTSSPTDTAPSVIS